MILKQAYSKLVKNKIRVFFYFILINLPLSIFTFNASNWGDDYQYTNLLALKAKFSPILPLIFESTGGHFVPVYNLINILITYVSINPIFFHFIIMICYVATAFLVFLFADRYYEDKSLGLLAGTLFSINYYISFKAFSWNCFHSHVTNTFTGLISLYFLIRYLQEKKKYFLLICFTFFLLTILNFESGFVFLPVFFIITLFSLLKKQITFKKSVMIVLVLLIVAALFPIGSYLETGKAITLSNRFSQAGRWSRSIGGYLFRGNDLFIKSTGFSIFYNKLVFNKLKKDSQLKETVIGLVRQHKKLNLKDLPLKFIVMLLILSIFTILLFIFITVVILTRIRKQTYLFVTIYGCLFLVYLIIFYRTDIANAIAVPSSIIIADFIISFLRDKKKKYRIIGMAIIGLYLFATSWVIVDKFDDCYRKSFFGLSKVAVQGPDKIYQDINRKIGRFVKDGIILFTHDYSQYHETGDYMRIGDMIGLTDFVCLNAVVYYQDLMKTDIPKECRHKLIRELRSRLQSNPNNKEVIVSSVDDALRYLRSNKVDTSRVEAIYLTKDYKVIRLEK